MSDERRGGLFVCWGGRMGGLDDSSRLGGSLAFRHDGVQCLILVGVEASVVIVWIKD